MPKAKGLRKNVSFVTSDSLHGNNDANTATKVIRARARPRRPFARVVGNHRNESTIKSGRAIVVA